MYWIKEMFKVEKPIIGMLHLDALPNDPRFVPGTSLEEIIEHARMDLNSLIKGGVDGVLISNEFSFPYQRKMDYITVACMASIIGELKKELKVPFGVDAISDGLATIELACGVNADFCRGTFSGAYVGDGGFYDNDVAHLLRRKKALYREDLKMLYFVNPESDLNLDSRELPKIAKSLVFKTGAEGLCVSANSAGESVDTNLLKAVKNTVPNTVVVANTGCNLETISEKLAYADMAIVGTHFKKDGLLQDKDNKNMRVDVNRVEEFMRLVKEIRRSYHE